MLSAQVQTRSPHENKCAESFRASAAYTAIGRRAAVCAYVQLRVRRVTEVCQIPGVKLGSASGPEPDNTNVACEGQVWLGVRGANVLQPSIARMGGAIVGRNKRSALRRCALRRLAARHMLHREGGGNIPQHGAGEFDAVGEFGQA